MMGSIIGDIVGSLYEFHNIKTKEFPLFSDRSGYTDDVFQKILDGFYKGKYDMKTLNYM